MSGSRSRSAFTLMEMMVVVTVIIALAGIGLPIYRAIMQQMKTSATRMLVKQVAMAIDAYRPQRWQWVDSSGLQGNGFTFGLKLPTACIDSTGQPITGLPAEAVTIDALTEPVGGIPVGDLRRFERPGSFAGGLQLFASGYQGFYDMVGGGIEPRFVNDSLKNPNLPHHQIIDAWGEPLRVIFAKKVFGTMRCGVWSPGRNLVDDIDGALQPKLNATGKACDDIRSWVEVDDEK